MAKVKTFILTGTEVCVENLGGQNAAVKNLGEGSVYASAYPNIIPGEDNVIEITAGSGEVVLDTHGTVYLLGAGKVQCTGTDYATINFGAALASGGGSANGGTTGGVSQAYVDARDVDTLTNSKTYTDSKVTPLKIDVEGNTEDIGDLKNRVTDTESAIDKLNGTGEGSVKKTAANEVAKIVADAPESLNSLGKIAEWIAEHPEDAAALNELIQQNKQDIADINNEATGILAKAERHTDEQLSPINNNIANLQVGKADKTDIPTTLPANGGNADTVGGYTVNSDVPKNAVFTDTTYSDMQGATESAAGAAGLVPAPAAGEEQRYLSAKGSFSNPMTPIGVTVTGLNLDDYKTSGMFYFIAGAKPDNRPAGSTSNGILIVIKANDSQIRQIWFDGTDKIYIRAYLGNEWTAWIKIVTETVAISAAYGENEDQAAEIMQQLSELDSRSIRPLRAIFAGTATDEDRDKLAEIEGQAVALRGELAVLGGD